MMEGTGPGSDSRLTEILFEVFEPLPRQGPGSRASAARALGLCSELPSRPAVLDLGCGAGGQTLQLAELTAASSIVAVDSHSPSIERLRTAAAEQGVADRIRPLVGDIGNPDQASESFDLIWSEGALYNIGIDNALRTYHGLLRPGGYFAFTEAVWRKDDPPPEVESSFEDYPAMAWARDVSALIEKTDFSLVGHFTLPDEAWWDDFYTPMEQRIEALRGEYAEDAEALAALASLAEEPEMHRRYSEYYAYEFFVVRKVDRLRVFFYGLFMDEALLADKGVKPRETAVGCVEGFALRIGRRATMERKPGSRAYGVSMTITAEEAAALYAEDSVADYRPEPVTVTHEDGGTVEAVSYVLLDGPDAGANRDYAAALSQLANRLGLPEGYCAEIRRLGD